MKDRYKNRKQYSEIEINKLVSKVNGYKSLFSNKMFDSKKKWNNDIYRHLDENSCNLFFYKLYVIYNTLPKCKNKMCDNTLGYDSYSYKSGYKYYSKGFQKYCTECTENEVWKRKKYNNKNYIEISEKIQNTKRKWIQSKDGRKFYKMLGEKNSEGLKRHFATEKGKMQILNASKKQSKTMKDKILNGEFTPNINNYFTNWNAEIKFDGKDKKFRSSWEACFWLCNKKLKYENIRIPYINEKGENHITIVDFNDVENGIIYEIKPKKFFLLQKIKIDAIIKYCIKNGLKFKWINEYNIMEYINESQFIGENKNQLLKMKKGIYEKIKN